jgi:hypothetical protein
MSQTLEKCENCNRTIGKLEDPYLWQNSTVCEQCYTLLNKSVKAAPVETGMSLQDLRREEAAKLGYTAPDAVVKRPYYPPPSSKKHMPWSVSLMVLGIVCFIGGSTLYKSFTGLAEDRYMETVGGYVLVVGIIMFLVGILAKAVAMGNKEGRG